MLDNEFKKSAMEKVTTMSANEYKEAFNAIGSELQTNEEWLCQLSTEEKAKWLADNFGYVSYKASGGKPETVQEQFIEYWQQWLKQPHHESVTNCNE